MDKAEIIKKFNRLGITDEVDIDKFIQIGESHSEYFKSQTGMFLEMDYFVTGMIKGLQESTKIFKSLITAMEYADKKINKLRKRKPKYSVGGKRW